MQSFECSGEYCRWFTRSRHPRNGYWLAWKCWYKCWSKKDQPHIIYKYLNERDLLGRSSMDTRKIYKHGGDLLDLCKSKNMVKLNGHVGLNKGIGHFTRVDTTGCSIVDYLLSKYMYNRWGEILCCTSKIGPVRSSTINILCQVKNLVRQHRVRHMGITSLIIWNDENLSNIHSKRTAISREPIEPH